MTERAKQARYDFARQREEARDRYFMRVWSCCVVLPTIVVGLSFVLIIASSARATFASDLPWVGGLILLVLLLGAVLGLPTAFVSARLRYGPKRSLSKGRCAKCGYDLRGSVSVVCPECGVAVADESILAAAPVERDDGTGV